MNLLVLCLALACCDTHHDAPGIARAQQPATGGATGRTGGPGHTTAALEGGCVRQTRAGIIAYTSVWQAVREAQDGDVIHLSEGVYREAMCLTGNPLRPGGRNISIIGHGTARIVVTITDAPDVNECAVNLSGMHELRISNIVFHAICRGDNMQRVYNAWFNGCTDTVIERCVFQSDVYGSNNIFKTYVATGGASNIVVRNAIIATADRTGMNSVSHSATHDADPTIFDNVDFCGMHVETLEVGAVILWNCLANEPPARQGGSRFGSLRIDAGERPMALIMKKLAAGALLTPADIPARVNLLANPDFDGLTGWSYWVSSSSATNTVTCKSLAPLAHEGLRGCVRIENPRAEIVGLQQSTALVSGAVYRLSAVAQSVATNDASVAFGGRVALSLPPQPEEELVWMCEYNHWWSKALVFTNQVSGTATVSVHMGYGRIASTGEFAAIRLERIAE